MKGRFYGNLACRAAVSGLAVTLVCIPAAGLAGGMEVYAMDSSPAVCAGTQGTEMDAYSLQVLTLVNAERTKYGLSALAWSAGLYAAAAVRSGELPRYFSHTRPDGTPWYTIVDANGYANCRVGENLAYGQVTPQEVVQDWMNSPAHRAIILDANMTETGICAVKANGVIYWAEEFGTRR